ncbi:methyl-accepting chemotaxis protein [Ideonella sp. DXS29W]|uniref:Methyl-accepting chemotaxis protein n=1 Tax=Ideonella lacteola TaxID=2984193 RepID=A0ABU9BY80_9BURK
MRLNQPVTQREFLFEDDATLMSTTDKSSRITYANAAFVNASGFSAEQLTGQPHNIVRHPDMPREAFADMWATLQRGESWTGLVKNRRANGDHYWVRANATPVTRAGQITGYLSVRTKPTREEVAGAEALYAGFREGTMAKRYRLHKGVLLRRGWASLFTLNKVLPVRWRLGLPLGLLYLSSVTAAAALGTRGLTLAELAGGMALPAALSMWWLHRQIAVPIEQLRAHAQKVANGSHDTVQTDRVDELGMTQRAVNQLGLMLRWVVSDVASQVGSLKIATDEIAQGNFDLSARTEQAASSLQETASSMEQMSATVKHSADTAEQAAALSTQAGEAAEQGRESVERVNQTMEGIIQSSRKISEIIGVIDGIAFQTNILALNAAVEAARAGEQGRGFAVVAGEVRSLAQRSAHAAKEIKGLITDSSTRVEDGAREVATASDAMSGIGAQIERMRQMINEISTGSREQANGIGQVNQAVSLLDQTTQQNAALVEQSAAAAQSLKYQAAQLVGAVSAFCAV